MEYTTLFAVWAVAITGPCVISWLVGDVMGSARTRELYAGIDASHDCIASETDHAHAFTVDAWRVSGSIHPLVEAAEPVAWEAHRSPSIEEQAEAAELRRLRRGALAGVRLRRHSIGETLPEGCERRKTLTVSRLSDPIQIVSDYAHAVEGLPYAECAVATDIKRMPYGRVDLISADKPRYTT